jgi:integrase/recombinase XerD
VESIAIVVGWLDWLRGQGNADRTVGIYRSHASRFLLEYVKGGLEEATEQHVSRFLRDVGERGPAGRRQAFQAVRSLCSYAQRRGMIPADPTMDFRVKKPHGRPQVALTEDELLRYFLAAYWRGGERRMWSLMLAFGLGTRRSELVHVEPSDVVDERVHLRVCKGGKDRWVPLSRYASLALEGLRPWYNGTVLGGLEAGGLSAWGKQAAKDSGLWPRVRGRTLHVLRASYASHLLRKGVPVNNVRDLLGHTNIAVTNEYAVSFDEDLVEGAAKL